MLTVFPLNSALIVDHRINVECLFTVRAAHNSRSQVTEAVCGGGVLAESGRAQLRAGGGLPAERGPGPDGRSGESAPHASCTIEINNELEVFVQISKTDVGFGNNGG